MPAKKITKTKKVASSGRLPRRSGARSLTRSTAQKKARSLSETRQSSSIKSKTPARRVSVAPKSNSRPSQKGSLSASVYDVKGKAIGRVSLPVEIFGVEVKPSLLAQAVRVYLANQRQGTLSTKTRGEVQGSTRKIYRQKGTGRARHGGIRAPIFVHGGIAFGPKPRDFSLSMPQKMRRQALFGALSTKLKDGEIKIMGGLEKIQPKTKVMAKALKSLEINGKTLLVTPGGYKNFESVFRAARNIEGVKIMTAETLNTYDVLNNRALILMKESIDTIKKHYKV